MVKGRWLLVCKGVMFGSKMLVRMIQTYNLYSAAILYLILDEK